MLSSRNIKIFIGILFLISIFIFFEYKEYASRKNHYEFPLSLDIDYAIVKYNQLVKKSKFSKNEFEEFIKSDTIIVENLSMLDEMNYNILFMGDSLFVYDFGFDNIDDNFKKSYLVEEISFLNSFFIKGDILLYKNEINRLSIKEGIDFNFERLDTIPPPPRPIPQYILDSLNDSEIDSIERIKFINNYGKNK